MGKIMVPVIGIAHNVGRCSTYDFKKWNIKWFITSVLPNIDAMVLPYQFQLNATQNEL